MKKLWILGIASLSATFSDVVTAQGVEPVEAKPVEAKPVPTQGGAAQGGAAQGDAAQGDGTEAPAPAPVETAKDRLAKLKAELAKKKAELEHIKGMGAKGGLAARVRAFFGERTVPTEGFEDPNFTGPPQPGAVPAPPSAKKARLLGDAEKEKLAADVILTVNGSPVTEKDFEATYAYLQSAGKEATDEELKTQAIQWLVYRAAAQSTFSAEELGKAKQRIDNAKAKLDGGTEFAEVAKEFSQCPSKDQGGDLGFWGRDAGLDLFYERAMFETKVGEVTKIVPTTFGYHLIKVTGQKKTGDRNEIKSSHILAMYSDDQMRVRQVRMDVDQGTADLAFRDDKFRKFAPASYR